MHDFKDFLNFLRFCYSRVDYSYFCRIMEVLPDYTIMNKFEAFKRDTSAFLCEYSDWAEMLWTEYNKVKK